MTARALIRVFVDTCGGPIVFRSLITFSVLLSILPVLAGCSRHAGPVRATWDYIELSRDENGRIKEIGDRHVFRSGGDEMYQIKGNTLDVITVTSAKAKFRLSGSDSAFKPEDVELEPGGRQDLWLGTFGVRLRVEKIGPIL